MADDEKPVVVPRADLAAAADPPVVARLVVEIRSDGTRTIARGALQDAALGQEVAIQAEGTTPMALAYALVKSMVKAPFLARSFARAFLRSKRDPR
jgi:hypothetical protein